MLKDTQQVGRCLAAMAQVSPYCGVARHAEVRPILELLKGLETGSAVRAELKQQQRQIGYRWLEKAVERGAGYDLETAVIEALLADDHLFMRQTEQKPLKQIHPALIETMRRDLRCLQALARLQLGDLLEEGTIDADRADGGGQNIEARFRAAEDWGSLVEELAAYVFGRHLVYRFEWDGKTARLKPIEAFAAFDLDWLSGQDDRLDTIEDNTLHLIRGWPVLNTLIWGPRGGGKSSIIRGLIQRYAAKGLRGIEISPLTYKGLAGLYDLVRLRQEFFIGVLDNISMDRSDPGFRLLSSLMEGTLEQRPANLVFYATSNYKDLVDRHGERPSGLGRLQMDESPQINQGIRPETYDPQQHERQDEQRALDDRFALKVFIDLPAKAQYERMVLEYARRAGVDAPADELLAQFKIWCMRHNHDLIGGRTARDFILAQYPEKAQALSPERQGQDA